MKFFILLLITFLSSLIACKKTSDILIDGKITDIKTGDPIGGVSISLYETAPGLFGNDEYLLETVTSNGSGNFEFNSQKKSDKTNGYFIKTSKENYFGDYRILINKDDLILSKTFTKNLQIYPMAFIRVHVKNIQPFNSSDFCSYDFTYSGLLPTASSPGSMFYGTNVDKTVLGYTYANEYTIITSVIKKNNIRQEIKDSIYCSRFTTADYSINY